MDRLRLMSPKSLSHNCHICLAAALIISGCAHGLGAVAGGAPTSDAPGIPWSPPASVRTAPRSEAPAIPVDLQSTSREWSLDDVIDVALRNSSEARVAWETARSAAARYGSARGAYFPEVDWNADYTRQKSAAFGTRASSEQRSYRGNLGVTWLLTDFGGRRAEVQQARQELLAANWEHSAAIQQIILDVQRAYFGHTAARALESSERSAVEEARRNLDAANARHGSGLATIADVLQAKTALAQAQLALDTVSGEISTTRGVLATAMGLPASADFDVALEDDTPPITEVESAVEAYLERARSERPELAAARAEADAAAARARVVRAEGHPRLTGEADVGRTYLDSPDREQPTYRASVGLEWSLFKGFSHQYDVRAAEAEARAQSARLADVEQQVLLDVWTSYFNLKTAGQRLRTSEDLFQSANESHEVSAGRYRAGVGSILDLLSTQAALENARATRVQARADWYMAVAQLAHDTGTLGPRTARAPEPNEEPKR